MVNGKEASFLAHGEAGCGVERVGDQKEGHLICLDEEDAMAPVSVPEASFYVLSDDRASKDDSRSWGVVPRDLIQSRISYVLLSYGLDSDPLPGLRKDRIFQKDFQKK